MWNKEDNSFKALINKRATNSGKAQNEEYGDFTLDVSFSEIKTQTIPFNDPTTAVANGVAKQYTFFELTNEPTVSNFQSYYAYDPADTTGSPTDHRLRDWISDKYGGSYGIKLYDSNNNEIYPFDGSGWLFNSMTGILNFNGNTSAFLKPFKISGYRYIGSKGGSVGSGGGNATDTDYNYMTWIADSLTPPSRRVTAKKFDELENLLNLLSPAHSALLGVLTISNTLYTGRIASGLPASWYGTGITAGTVVNSLFYDNTVTLSFNDFRAGKVNAPETYGVFTETTTLSNNTSTTVTYNMSGGAGTIAGLTIGGISVFNSIWTKASASYGVSQSEGYAKYVFQHTEAGTSNPSILFYDPTTVLPTFTGTPSLSVRNKVSKWLSGIELFGNGTELYTTYSVNNLFQKVYIPVGATQIDCPAMTLLNADPVSTQAFNAVFNVVNKTLALNQLNISSSNPMVTVTARKPNNLQAATTTADVKSLLGLGINTYGIVSTTTIDLFQDEANRVYADTNTAFNSAATLPNGEGVVYNGTLSYGRSFYAPKSGVQRYDKRVTKVASPSGEIKLSGINYADLASSGTGALNVFIKLETQGLIYDLSKPFGVDNGTGDGLSFANAKGCYVATTADGYFNFSFGTNSTADNGNIYRVIVLFRNDTAPTITRLETR